MVYNPTPDAVNQWVRDTASALQNAASGSTPLSVTGGGGGTQYTDGAASPTHMVGTVPVFNNAGTVAEVSNSTGLPVNVVAGSGSGLSVQDAAAWTTGTSNFVPGGGVFNDSATALTSGQQGTQRLTPNRGEHVNLRNNSGTEVGTTTTPLVTGGNVASLATDAGNPIKVGAVYNTSAPAPTTGQRVDLQVDSSGKLKTQSQIFDPGSGNGATITAAGAVKTDGSAVTQPVAGNVASLATDSGNPVKVGAVYNTSLPTPTNGQRVDLQSDSTGRLITNNRALAIGTDAVSAQVNAGTSGGWTQSSQTAFTNTVVAVKASAGQLGGYMFYNPNTTAAYIQVFNVVSGSVTVGTTAPTYVLPLPAGAAGNVNFGAGIAHSTAISAAATTTPTGSTAPSSNLVGFFLYA